MPRARLQARHATVTRQGCRVAGGQCKLDCCAAFLDAGHARVHVPVRDSPVMPAAHQIHDFQLARRERPCPFMDGLARQPRISVMGATHGDARTVVVFHAEFFGQGPSGHPEPGPDFGRVLVVHHHGIVRGGAALSPGRSMTFRCRPPRAGRTKTVQRSGCRHGRGRADSPVQWAHSPERPCTLARLPGYSRYPPGDRHQISARMSRSGMSREPPAAHNRPTVAPELPRCPGPR